MCEALEELFEELFADKITAMKSIAEQHGLECGIEQGIERGIEVFVLDNLEENWFYQAIFCNCSPDNLCHILIICLLFFLNRMPYHRLPLFRLNLSFI